jgi:hypothetical protein
MTINYVNVLDIVESYVRQSFVANCVNYKGVVRNSYGLTKLGVLDGFNIFHSIDDIVTYKLPVISLIGSGTNHQNSYFIINEVLSSNPSTGVLVLDQHDDSQPFSAKGFLDCDNFLDVLKYKHPNLKICIAGINSSNEHFLSGLEDVLYITATDLKEDFDNSLSRIKEYLPKPIYLSIDLDHLVFSRKGNYSFPFLERNAWSHGEVSLEESLGIIDYVKDDLIGVDVCGHQSISPWRSCGFTGTLLAMALMINKVTKKLPGNELLSYFYKKDDWCDLNKNERKLLKDLRKT